MERPKTASMMLASEWITHLTNEHAWDEMREVVERDPDRAWRIIRAVIGSAPDYAVLATVAAGPVEDLIDEHGDSILSLIADEAKRNARLRICLRAAYSDFPTELQQLVETESADVRDLPADEEAASSARIWPLSFRGFTTQTQRGLRTF